MQDYRAAAGCPLEDVRRGPGRCPFPDPLPLASPGPAGQGRVIERAVRATGLAVALSISVLLRTLESGSDVTRRGWSQVAGWELTIAAGALLLGAPEP